MKSAVYSKALLLLSTYGWLPGTPLTKTTSPTRVPSPTALLLVAVSLLFHGTCPVPPISVRVPRREALLGIFTSDTNVKVREIGKSRGKGTCGNSGYLISPIPGREISGFYKQPSSERRLLLHTLCRDDLSKS